MIQKRKLFLSIVSLEVLHYRGGGDARSYTHREMLRRSGVLWTGIPLAKQGKAVRKTARPSSGHKHYILPQHQVQLRFNYLF